MELEKEDERSKLTSWKDLIPNGVSTNTAVYNCAGVSAMVIAPSCSKLPKG